MNTQLKQRLTDTAKVLTPGASISAAVFGTMMVAMKQADAAPAFQRQVFTDFEAGVTFDFTTQDRKFWGRMKSDQGGIALFEGKNRMYYWDNNGSACVGRIDMRGPVVTLMFDGRLRPGTVCKKTGTTEVFWTRLTKTYYEEDPNAPENYDGDIPRNN